MNYLGIDTGGTFTDFVLFSAGGIRVHKVLSTPADPGEAILQGIRELGIDTEELRIVHGSTVATNAVLQGRGVRTLYIGNRGFTDLLTIGRQNRPQLYELQPQCLPPPLESSLCLGIDARLDAGGKVLQPLSEDDLRRIDRAVRDLQPRSVAVNLLFSYLDDSAEQAIAQRLPETVFCSLSSQVLPEIREYERGMATWLNAWVAPLVAGYLQRLNQALPHTAIAVMQSSGDTIAADQAARQAVRMLLSGPAGGLVGAGFVAGAAAQGKLLSFDMGGTSTDVALIDGMPKLTSEGRIGPYPVAVPMVDMHTIGAGGGSIAWLDDGGMLQVGPQSAGADPGPACYGRGGEQPTVTDANLVLGRIAADAFLGGRMRLDPGAAEAAVQRLAAKMGCSGEQAAKGIIEVANEHMARALRQVSVQRGVDPGHYTLVSFGGAGGLHVCALAEKLGLKQALVPVHAGVLSALGMLGARPGRRLSRTWLQPLEGVRDADILRAMEQMREQGCTELEAEGVPASSCDCRFSLDLRYRGQSCTLEVPWRSNARVIDDFHRRHRQRYGHTMDLPVELVNLRVAVSGPAPVLQLTRRSSVETGAAAGTRPDCFLRTELRPGQEVVGPAMITEDIATTWLAEGWVCRLDERGNLVLRMS